MRRLFLLAAAAAVAAAPAQAAPPYACILKAGGGYMEPATLTGLLECQEKVRKEKAYGDVDIDAFQRVETRDYMARRKKKESIRKAKTLDASHIPKKVAKQKARTRAAMEKNARGFAPEKAASLQALEESLWEQSDNGKAGVTPQMAADILGFLTQHQGGASVEMRQLLKSLSADGSDLSKDSMKQLKKASRDAKSAGLDLGLAPDMEKYMLDRKTDPSAEDIAQESRSRPGTQVGSN